MSKVDIKRQPPSYTLESVTSKDGSTLTYRRLGDGCGVLLLHGGLQAAQNLMLLASALSDAFTLYILNRRGRGSGPYPPGYSIQTEREDVEALLRKTGASRVFGLSSGGIVALEAARCMPELRKVAVYEPPFSVRKAVPTEWLGQFDKEIEASNPAAALVTALKGTQTSPVLARVPRFLLVPLFRYMLAQDRKNHPSGDIPIEKIIPTMHYDVQLAKDTEGTIESFRAVDADVLLMGGSKSPAYLRLALDELEAVLARSRRVEFPGLDHQAPDNSEQPSRVAAKLREFFA
jgi:pimeloyl-ACP methyl ester carboxylesterase